MNSIYRINKGINKPLEFKGLKAQYIAYLAVGLVLLMLLFAILYICGLNLYCCVLVIGTSGTVLFNWVTRTSKKYGRYGLMKKAAAKRVPTHLKPGSRKIFLSLLVKQRES